MMPSKTERLAFWRDEYDVRSLDLQRLLPFMLSQSAMPPRMRISATVSAVVL